MIEEANFTYTPLGKTLEKQIELIEGQGEKQIKAIEDHGKQLVESNEIIKKDFDIDRNTVPLEEQNKYLMGLLKNNIMNFRTWKKKFILII